MIERGHVEGPGPRVTLDWVTAKALLVDGNPQAAMGAFMEGKVRIEGDVAQADVVAVGVIDPGAQQAAARIRR